MVPPIYGPVPSRRLGFSLGLDILPFKTCTFDCIYCQLGRTARKTNRRKSFVQEAEIIPSLTKLLPSIPEPDCLTFSGLGEPTLNSAIGPLIRRLKKITALPIVVLTNSSLLSRKQVRRDLCMADIIVPSLDAASPEIFSKINRPHPSIKIENVIGGLVQFRKEYKGKIWLEVMLVKGINDSSAHLKKLKAAIDRINPDRIQLNTVVRPPADKQARALDVKDLKKIKNVFGPRCTIVADFKKKYRKSSSKDLAEAILALVQRRPVTSRDISASLGKEEKEILKYLELFCRQGKMRRTDYHKHHYYESASKT